MASASAYRSTYASRSWSSVGVRLGGVAARVGELVELVPGLGGELVQLRRELEVVQALGDAAQAGVDEPVAVADLLALGVQDVLELELLAELHHDLDPVVEQVAVPDEDAAAVGHRLAGGALGVQQHVQPAGGEVRGAEAVGVVLLLAADHLRRRAQHRGEDRDRAVADRGDPPQAEEPAQPRVLDDQLVTLGEVAVEPLGGLDALGLAGGDPAGLEPGLGSRVADLDARVLEQPVVVLDHPGRLAEPLGVGLVGDHLGLRDVQAHQLHEARQRARAAAAGAGDEQHLAGVVRGLEITRCADLACLAEVTVVGVLTAAKPIRWLSLASLREVRPTTSAGGAARLGRRAGVRRRAVAPGVARQPARPGGRRPRGGRRGRRLARLRRRDRRASTPPATTA